MGCSLNTPGLDSKCRLVCTEAKEVCSDWDAATHFDNKPVSLETLSFHTLCFPQLQDNYVFQTGVTMWAFVFPGVTNLWSAELTGETTYFVCACGSMCSSISTASYLPHLFQVFLSKDRTDWSFIDCLNDAWIKLNVDAPNQDTENSVHFFKIFNWW